MIWLKDKGCPWDVVRYINNYSIYISTLIYLKETCEVAAGTSLLQLQWLRKHGCPWDAQTCASALGIIV